MSVKITPHFTLEEMTVTKTGYKNEVSYDAIDNLRDLCRDVLEPLRQTLRHPIVVTSGYRSPLVNLAVGGSKNSEHMFGRAADIHCDYESATFLFDSIQALVSQGIIHVGQCILYPKKHFVHVSLYTSRHKDEFIVKS